MVIRMVVMIMIIKMKMIIIKTRSHDLPKKAQEPSVEMYSLTFMSQSLIFLFFPSCPVVHMHCVLLLHPLERCFSVVLMPSSRMQMLCNYWAFLALCLGERRSWALRSCCCPSTKSGSTWSQVFPAASSNLAFPSSRSNQFVPWRDCILCYSVILGGECLFFGASLLFQCHSWCRIPGCNLVNGFRGQWSSNNFLLFILESVLFKHTHIQ